MLRKVKFAAYSSFVGRDNYVEQVSLTLLASLSHPLREELG